MHIKNFVVSGTKFTGLFLDLDYKIELTSDHVAKFCNDRPMELGDLALKKKKKNNISSKT